MSGMNPQIFGDAKTPFSGRFSGIPFRSSRLVHFVRILILLGWRAGGPHSGPSVKRDAMVGETGVEPVTSCL